MSNDSEEMYINSISSGFFGKLPGYTDFIKFNTVGKEILLLDNWIQEGLSWAKIKYKDQWKNYYNNCSKINFLYPFTESENFIQGLVFPSNDKSGRIYPFILYNNLDKAISFNLPYYLIPSAFQQLYISYNEIADLDNSKNVLFNMKELITNLNYNIPNINLVKDDYKRFVNETQLGDITNFGDKKELELIILFKERMYILEHLVVYNFPYISFSTNNLFLLSYYIQILQKVFKNSDSTPGIFWIQREDTSWILFLSFVKPTPNDFLDIFFYESINSNLCEGKIDFKYKNQTSLNAIFNINSVVKKNLRLSEFLNSLEYHLS